MASEADGAVRARKAQDYALTGQWLARYKLDGKWHVVPTNTSRAARYETAATARENARIVYALRAGY